MKPASARRRDGERGTVLIFVAGILVGLLGIGAIVLDLGALRLDRGIDRAATDAAATAAASVMGVEEDVLAGCETAWSYVVGNLGLGTPASPCSATFSTGPCTSATTLVATKTVGDYEISIANPVLDTDTDWLRAPLAGGGQAQSVDVSADGVPCERVGVRVTRVRSLVLGRVLGSTSAQTDVHSVARAVMKTSAGGRFPALVALEPNACGAVNAGTGQIEAHNIGDIPGRIYADSTASVNPCGHVFDVKNSGRIKAFPGADGTPGELGYIAPLAKAFSAGGGASWLGDRVLLQQPTTRMPPDRRYHCTKLTPACKPAKDAMLDLETRYAGSGTPAFPTSYSLFPGPTGSCNTPPPTFGPGNWYIDCPTLNAGGGITFAGGGVIVFSGSVLAGSLVINPSASTDTTVVVRGAGGLSVGSSGSITMRRTFVYNVAGGVSLQGGPSITWDAPTGGSFKDLLYWSEATTGVDVQGGPSLAMDGIWVMPNAGVVAAGSGTVDATNVQFWVRRVETQGAARFIMRPNPNRAISISPAGSALIR